MRLPDPSAHFSQRVRCGNYVSRRLRRAKRTALANDVEKATLAVLLAGRADEDADKPIQDAMADRDGADDDLDDGAQAARAELAGRSADAETKAPYTLLFPDGLRYYTHAPNDEEVKRYGELKLRMETYLDPTDKVRLTTVPILDAGIAAFTLATTTLGTARNQQALTATALTAATDAWAKVMEQTWGSLVGEIGKKAADRFFPRKKRSNKKTGATKQPAPATSPASAATPAPTKKPV